MCYAPMVHVAFACLVMHFSQRERANEMSEVRFKMLDALRVHKFAEPIAARSTLAYWGDLIHRRFVADNLHITSKQEHGGHAEVVQAVQSAAQDSQGGTSEVLSLLRESQKETAECRKEVAESRKETAASRRETEASRRETAESRKETAELMAMLRSLVAPTAQGRSWAASAGQSTAATTAGGSNPSGSGQQEGSDEGGGNRSIGGQQQDSDDNDVIIADDVPSTPAAPRDAFSQLVHPTADTRISLKGKTASELYRLSMAQYGGCAPLLEKRELGPANTTIRWFNGMATTEERALFKNPLGDKGTQRYRLNELNDLVVARLVCAFKAGNLEVPNLLLELGYPLPAMAITSRLKELKKNKIATIDFPSPPDFAAWRVNRKREAEEAAQREAAQQEAPVRSMRQRIM
mmetsp:Transcript_3690/g.6276  ORF Transcript_3690/g.6276 Transcript_3690/m.6276 type:complete len:406 (-) Transcript_3690:539-1756(-)